MSGHLKDIIESMKQELSDTIFIQFVESLEENDFGINENQDYLKILYTDIVEFYKCREEIDDEN